MTQNDWNSGARCLGFFLNGEGITAPGPEGERVEDDSFVLLFNASGEDCTFRTPTKRFGAEWTQVLDTAAPDVIPRALRVRAQEELTVTSRSLKLLRRAD